MSTAFITGITGQDGSYLAELLLRKGYVVHGLVHRPDTLNQSNIRHLVADSSLESRLHLHPGDFEDTSSLRRLLTRIEPDEIYHLAGQSSPRASLDMPESTLGSVGFATLRLLEILRDLSSPPRFLYAASAEIFGEPAYSPQDELTPVRPSTPYGAAKALSFQLTRIYRSAYGMGTCSAVLYNHESPRRGDGFVTQKIARAAARIARGLETTVTLGNVEAKRDWGWAPDYVHGMWLMLQADPVDDFVLATGQLHSVAEWAEACFEAVGLDWRQHVKTDRSLIPAAEPIAPCGNPSKAQRVLGWQNTVDFRTMARRMVQAQLDLLPL